MQYTQVTKQLITASSTLIGVLSTAAVYTANAGTPMPLDTARRVILWSSAVDASGLIVTVTGTREGGQSLIEQLVCSTNAASPRATVGDFLTVTSVSASSTPEAIVNVGTNNQGGTPWKLTAHPLNNAVAGGAALTFSSTSNSVAASLEITWDDITQTYPSPLTTLSTATTAILFKPSVFIAAGNLSTATGTTQGGIGGTNPMAWRMTLTSSSSTAGIVKCQVTQTGP